jgi:hypothetical protein
VEIATATLIGHLSSAQRWAGDFSAILPHLILTTLLFPKELHHFQFFQMRKLRWWEVEKHVYGTESAMGNVGNPYKCWEDRKSVRRKLYIPHLFLTCIDCIWGWGTGSKEMWMIWIILQNLVVLLFSHLNLGGGIRISMDLSFGSIGPGISNQNKPQFSSRSCGSRVANPGGLFCSPFYILLLSSWLLTVFGPPLWKRKSAQQSNFKLSFMQRI